MGENNMLSRRLLIAAFALTFPSAAFAGPAAPARAGDPVHGAELYRLHCASCHGPDGTGGGYLSQTLTSPPPTNLKRPGFLVSRGDKQLFAAIMQGGEAAGAKFTMPAFGRNLGVLDAWDLVAWIRQGQLEVVDFWPEAAKFTAKDYTLDADALKRLEDVVTDYSEKEKSVTVVTAFSGENKPADGPEFVPQDPRLIANLKPKQKLGYVAFVDVEVPGLKQPVGLGISMARDGVIQKIAARLDGLP
ncbi:MAG: c-type cytochrome, partial [Myxococcales bacterium]